MIVSPDTPIADIATKYPETIPVFQRLLIDFCCEGRRQLGDVCADRKLSFDEVARALAASRTDHPARRHDWSTRPLSDLTAHIVEAFHEPVRDELPRLHRMAIKVQRNADPDRHTLAVVLCELERFSAEIEPHMATEERDLFPLIEAAEAGDTREGDRARFWRLRYTLEADHVEARRALQILRNVTDRYDASRHGCGTLRALYRGLEELEQLMQLHVHLENNVLFPRAAALMTEAGGERLAQDPSAAHLTQLPRTT